MIGKACANAQLAHYINKLPIEYLPIAKIAHVSFQCHDKTSLIAFSGSFQWHKKGSLPAEPSLEITLSLDFMNVVKLV